MLAGFLLDGGSYKLLDLLPNISKFYFSNSSSRIISETPPLSPVCWTSFLTGKDPSEHNIYGFIEKDPSNKFYVPNFSNIKEKTILHTLTQKKIRFASINIPCTYPPLPSKTGIIISDFLSPDLPGALNQKWMLPYLTSINYKIDIDPHEKNILSQINSILDSRKKLLHYLSSRNLDIILFHIMEFDRLCHYFYKHILSGNPFIHNTLKKIDSLFLTFLELFPDHSKFILSDHGFQPLNLEFFPNTLLYRNNLLNLNTSHINTQSNDLPIISPTYYFCLYPGRLYSINQSPPISELFLSLTHNNMPIIKKIIPSNTIYSKKAPFPYILIPEPHIDIKGYFTNHIFQSPKFQGMHDPSDGIFAYSQNTNIPPFIKISSVHDILFSSFESY